MTHRVGALALATLWLLSVAGAAVAGEYDDLDPQDRIARMGLIPDLNPWWRECTNAAQNADGRVGACSALLASGRLRRDPDLQAVALNNRGNAYMERGQTGLALTDFNGAVTLQPRYALAYYNRALAYASVGQHGRAVGDFDMAVRYGYDTAQAFNSRGISHWRSGRLAQAQADFDHALALDPTFLAAYLNRANLRLDMGDAAGALADLTRAQAYGPANAELHYARGRAAVVMGDVEGARIAFDQAIALDPALVEAYVARGWLALNGEALELALADGDLAVALAADYPGGHNLRGAALEALGRNADAAAAFSRALALGGPDYARRYQLALVGQDAYGGVVDGTNVAATEAAIRACVASRNCSVFLK